MLLFEALSEFVKQKLATLNYPMIDKNHPCKQWTEDFGPSWKSSHDFVSDWLTMEGNYSKYVGGLGQEGTTKKHFSLILQKKSLPVTMVKPILWWLFIIISVS